DCRPQVELEGWVLAGFLGEHGEHRRLRDEAGDEAQRLAGEPGSPPAPLMDVNRVDDGLGELPEPVSEPHLVEGVDAAGLQPVAAKGARKGGVPPPRPAPPPGGGGRGGAARPRGPRPDNDDVSDRHGATPLGLRTIPCRGYYLKAPWQVGLGIRRGTYSAL